MSQGDPLPAKISTYHCLCTTLVLTTVHDLESLPRRKEPVHDASLILIPPVEIARPDEVAESVQTSDSILTNLVLDRRPVMIRREDGFEKRTLLRCARCKLVIGYNLDDAHFDASSQNSKPVYLLPGGLLRTTDMAKGTLAEIPPWAEHAS